MTKWAGWVASVVVAMVVSYVVVSSHQAAGSVVTASMDDRITLTAPPQVRLFSSGGTKTITLPPSLVSGTVKAGDCFRFDGQGSGTLSVAPCFESMVPLPGSSVDIHGTLTIRLARAAGYFGPMCVFEDDLTTWQPCARIK